MEISADYTDYADFVLCLRSSQEDRESRGCTTGEGLPSVAARKAALHSSDRTAVPPNDISILQAAINPRPKSA
jgi:hypothetical protein